LYRGWWSGVSKKRFLCFCVDYAYGSEAVQ
jgi:hypothetical protein